MPKFKLNSPAFSWLTGQCSLQLNFQARLGALSALFSVLWSSCWMGTQSFTVRQRGLWTLVLSSLQTLPPGMELPGKTQSIVCVITIVKLFSKLSVTYYVSTSNLSFCFSTSLQILDVIKLHFGEDLVDLSPSCWIPHIW